jgi:hypothetical protein
MVQALGLVCQRQIAGQTVFSPAGGKKSIGLRSLLYTAVHERESDISGMAGLQVFWHHKFLIQPLQGIVWAGWYR